MGKLTIKDAEELVNANVLSTEDVENMQEAGAISKRQRNGKYTMKTADSKTVYPQLYYKGLAGGKYSKRMTEFRNEFTTSLTKYAKKENK